MTHLLCFAADPGVGVLQDVVPAPPEAAAHVVPAGPAGAQDPRGPRHGDLQEDDEQEDGYGQSQDEGVDDAAEHGGDDGEDEETQRTGEDVEDEAVLRSFSSFLECGSEMALGGSKVAA